MVEEKNIVQFSFIQNLDNLRAHSPKHTMENLRLQSLDRSPSCASMLPKLFSQSLVIIVVIVATYLRVVSIIVVIVTVTQ